MSAPRRDILGGRLGHLWPHAAYAWEAMRLAQTIATLRLWREVRRGAPSVEFVHWLGNACGEYGEREHVVRVAPHAYPVQALVTIVHEHAHALTPHHPLGIRSFHGRAWELSYGRIVRAMWGESLGARATWLQRNIPYGRDSALDHACTEIVAEAYPMLAEKVTFR